MIGRLLLRLARSRRMGRVIAWMFAHMSFVLPVQRLKETETLVAFHHPSPAYPVHVLIVPKRAYASWLDVPPDDAPFLHDLVAVVQQLVRELDLERRGYRLVVNGGAYQDVQQLHFHLISAD